MSESNKKTMAGFSTIGFVRKCFPWIFAIMIWLTVIGGMIWGAETGGFGFCNHVLWNNGIRIYSDEVPYMIIGGAIGLVGGFLVAIWTSGLVATLLKMDEIIQYMDTNLQDIADKGKAKE